MPPQRESRSPARREFLRRLTALSGAAAANAALPALAATPNASKSLHVVVVGAGLAGLVAAYELERRGHRVTILEADAHHVGGRARTLRFEGGLHGEAGAMRIPARHQLTRQYIAEFHLPLRPFVFSNPKAYYFVRGTRCRVGDVKSLYGLFALRDDERTQTPDYFWDAAVGKALRSLSEEEKVDLSADTPATNRIRAYDQQSLQQLLEAAGLSDEAIEFLATTSASETLLSSAATETLREELKEVWTQGFDELVDGTDTLASAFAKNLRSKPRLGCAVVRITQDPSRRRAAAIYRERGQERRVEGDFLLCTLPCPVLTRIAFEPGLSGPKARAIRQLNYDSSTKVLAIARWRFWEIDDGIFGGGTFTDLPIATAYYPSDNALSKNPRVSAGPGVLLASYSWGQAARRLASLPHPERAAAVLQSLSRVHPQLADRTLVRHTASWSWDNHPLSGGAFAWFMPGQHSALHRHIVAPEDRIYFAGEHASLTHTWMQGALESGLRATREMLEAAQTA
ncbi:MAG TPA: FAD-dependent oxidoreductase [Casimicrobiaceae bacterium]|nr:FAD-dependent oxidoreductase [Casimicrobiaceae bacterium]